MRFSRRRSGERDRADFVRYHVLKLFRSSGSGAAERWRWTARITP